MKKSLDTSVVAEKRVAGPKQRIQKVSEPWQSNNCGKKTE